MRIKKKIAPFLLLASICGIHSSAKAAISGFLSAPTGGTRSDPLPQEGFGFYGTSAGTATVNELGYWVAPADSAGGDVTAVDHTIALYHYNGTGYTDVAQAILPAGSAPDASGYAWVSIPTYTLSDTSQGADYYILTASCGTDLWTNGGLAVNNSSFGSFSSYGWFSEQAAFPGIGGTISSGTAPGSNTLNYSNTRYGGPNLGFAAAAVPEPTSMLFLGLGGLYTLTRRRCQIHRPVHI